MDGLVGRSGPAFPFASARKRRQAAPRMLFDPSNFGRRWRWVGLGCVLIGAPANARAAEAAPQTLRELYDAAAAWVEEHYTAEELAVLPAIDQEQFAALLQPVLQALAADEFEDMAVMREHAAHALAWLRAQPWGAPYADWLEPRMDYLDMALEAAQVWRARYREELERARAAPPERRPAPPRPEVVRQRIERAAQSRPAWDRKVAQHPPPARAAALVPQLKEAFRAEGVPPEWVWLAEVESSFNPDARSPVGARGLFQFMPATAQRFGLSVAPVDQRTDPERSARAAAQYLRFLHGRFGDWPLALAAYNAGEGRVGRTLATAGPKARTFDDIAARLPAETRFYVPKVLATVAAREGVDPLALPPPR
jgi:membrane-bound lytic murein transglycosylase D